jgi:hypothetical protein
VSSHGEHAGSLAGLKLLGAHIPVVQWTTQLTRQQKKDQAREVTQRDAATAGRPASPSQESEGTARDQCLGSVVPLRWPDRARQGETALDDERRHRRERAVPQRPAAPGGLGDRMRRTSLLLIPREEPEAEPEATARSGEAQ